MTYLITSCKNISLKELKATKRDAKEYGNYSNYINVKFRQYISDETSCKSLMTFLSHASTNIQNIILKKIIITVLSHTFIVL